MIQKKYVHMLIFAIGISVPVQYVYSQVMQSSTYKMQSDSINFAGGRSTSATYLIEDTIGEIASGRSAGTLYALGAGYQQMNEPTYITLTAASDLSLGSIGGIVGGATTGSQSWIVTTNNATGYSLSVKASTAPALKSGAYSFADYAPAGPDPDMTFTVAPTSSGFGFSPEGTDVIQRFKDNGSVCNAGSLNTVNACWDGFATTTKIVSLRNSSNLPSGSTTTLKYKVETGSSHIQEAGDYSAVITVTALTL